MPTIPSSGSEEFQLGGYLGPDKASVAFNDGATGQGILVADIDTGADPTRPDLMGAISPLSTDIISGRDQPVGTDPHANYVSSVLGARYNGFGTLGVAFDSTILSIRADTNDEFDDSDIAAGIEYAIANHAKVINLSLGGTDPGSSALQQALVDAANAGIAVTASAGNDSKPGNPALNPEWPAQYATDPRFGGLIVAVGAVDSSGQLASFSNEAGVAANGYIAAPGVNLTADCDNTGCEIVSGTSFSAPQVAGAIALLLQTFPNLTPAQAVQIILNSADDAGAPGTDAVYGRGILDLAAAFAPMGTMSVPQEFGAPLSVSAANLGGGRGVVTAMTGSALGDAVSRTQGLTTIGYDSYDRMFKINLAGAFQPTSVRGLIAAAPAMREMQADVPSSSGAGVVSFASGGALVPSQVLPADRMFSQETDPGYTQIEAGIGHLSLMAWHGQGGVEPQTAEPRDAFQEIAQPDMIEAAAYKLGAVSLVAEGGTGERLTPYASAPQKGSSYGRLGVDYQGQGFTARVAMGTLEEPLGPLGSMTTGSFALPASTRYMTVGATRDLPGGATLYGEASFGRTTFTGDILRLDGSLTSSWKIGLSGACAGRWVGCSHFGVELDQPLRFESGDITATLANVPDQYFAPLEFSQRRISAAPSGRELDLRVFADKGIGALGLLSLEATAASNEGNVAGAPVGLGFLGSWRLAF